MASPLSILPRLGLLAILGLTSALLSAACSIEPAVFVGPDGQQPPPGSATLTVARSGTGTGTVASSPGGIACGEACSAELPAGSSVTLTATPGAGAELAGWSGGGCSGTAPTCVVTVDAAVTVTVTFDKVRYPVTVDLGGSGAGMVASSAAGISCPGACTAMVAHGEQLSLTASSDAVSLFMGWTVGPGGTACAGTGACTTTITGPTTVTATFADYQALEIVRSGNGAGTVSSNPAGIDCGADCSELYPPGAAVVLTATPAASSIFMGWSGGGCAGTGACDVAVNGATMVTAEFRLRQYDLTVAKAGSGAGTVTSSPAGIDCGADCSELLNHGASVTLTATPTLGSVFAGWSGGGCTGMGTCTVTMTAAAAVTASFTLNAYALTVAKAGTGAGTVTSSPAGINCGSDCTETYGHGSTVTLAAAPSAGSTFAGWSGGGCTGTGTCTVTMVAATAVTATFTLNAYVLTVSRGGTGGGTVTSSPAGISCGSDCTESYGHGTTVTLTAAPSASSTFAGWSGAGCSGTGTCTVTMTATTFVTAVFTLKRYTLDVIKTGSGAGSIGFSPAGTSCGSNCQQYDHGTVVTLTATPAVNSFFGGWSGGGCSGTGTCTVAMTQDTTLGANFVRPTYTLSVAKAGAGAGTVTSSPAGINCGATCSMAVQHGASVTLTATPSAGSTFAGWSGGGCSGTGTCTVTVTAATSVTATFAQGAFTLTVSKGGTGGGTVTSSPSGISCGSDCTEPYAAGTMVTLAATPSAGSTFTGWSGACTGTGTCTVSMTAARFVTAVFTLSQYKLLVHETGSGTGGVAFSPAGTSCGVHCAVFDHGTVVTMTATADPLSYFDKWVGGGCSGSGTCTVTMTQDIELGAYFVWPIYTVSIFKDGTGTGTVKSTPGGINCGATCSAPLQNGTTVHLEAAPAPGSIFAGWSVPGCGSAATCSFSVGADTAVKATFIKQ